MRVDPAQKGAQTTILLFPPPSCYLSCIHTHYTLQQAKQSPNDPSTLLIMAIKLPPINYEKLNHLFEKLPFKGKCKDCSQEFDDETYYLCHHPCHQNKYKQTCPPSMYDPNCFKCALCSKVATNFTNLRYHYQYHAARRFQCLKCEYNAHSLAEIRRHVQKHLDIKLFPCQLCNRQYPDSKSLKEHLVRSHRGEAAYICSQCVNPFKDLNQFKRHLETHYAEAASKGSDPGKLFDLRTGVTPTGQTVSGAFQLRRKKRKRRRPENDNLPDLQPQPKGSKSEPIIDLEPSSSYQIGSSSSYQIGSSSSYQIGPNSGYQMRGCNSSSKQLVLPPPPPLTMNGIRTYSDRPRQTAHKVTMPRQTAHKVTMPRRVNRILGDCPRTFDKKYDNIINSNKPLVISKPPLNGPNSDVAPKAITVRRSMVPDTNIKTIDVGTFIPPAVGLADFIEAD